MTVRTDIIGHTLQITLDRPEKHNAFDDAVIARLTEAFRLPKENTAIRVIVLAANGKHFSAGADLAWMRRMADMDWQQNRDDAARLADLMDAIDRAPCPVICKVQGAAYGGALGLICAADIAIATPESRFCLSEVKLGILPAVISPYVVRAMGARQARRYFISGEVFDAEVACQCGVVHELADADTIDARVQEIITSLAGGAPEAQREARALIDHVAHQPPDDSMRQWTAELIARLRTSEEGREGLDAFLEKRAPSWKEPHG